MCTRSSPCGVFLNTTTLSKGRVAATRDVSAEGGGSARFGRAPFFAASAAPSVGAITEDNSALAISRPAKIRGCFTGLSGDDARLRPNANAASGTGGVFGLPAPELRHRRQLLDEFVERDGIIAHAHARGVVDRVGNGRGHAADSEF